MKSPASLVTLVLPATLLGGLLHNDLAVAASCPVPGFAAARTFDAGFRPFCVTAADFDNDGKLDLAVANFGSDNVSVLLGNGNGTFQSAVHYRTGTIPIAIAIGDFNGDGKLDVAVANSGSDNVSVLLGNGDGSFRAAVNHRVGSVPGSLAIGDFNGDGRSDLAVANYGSIDSSSRVYTNLGVSVLLGNGDGTVQDAVNYSAGTNPVSVVVGDFNRDGKADLAVGLAPTTIVGVSVLRGNGDGTFQGPVTVSALGQNLAVGDFNGDGKPDLARASVGSSFEPITSGDVSVLLNTCDSAGVPLDVTRRDSKVALSWPLSSAAFVLESTTTLRSVNWQRAAEQMTTNNGRCEVSVPLDPGQRYFRLRQP